jgi:LDH2 family malate/lactate/ureidoglycolate dehydrogenase
VPGVSRVLVPGEIELANESRMRAEGIPLAAAIASQLETLGAELGVRFPPPMAQPAASRLQPS